MGADITKVELKIGEASSITINSIKLIVSDKSDFSTQIDEITKSSPDASSTLTFTPTSPLTSFGEDAYYKFVFNVTVTDNSNNKFVEFLEAKFYKEAKTASDFTITSGSTVNLTKPSNTTSQITYTSSSDGAITYTSNDTEVATVSNTGLITAVAAGQTTITISQAETSTYEASSDKTITVNVVDNTKTATPSITVSPTVISEATDVTVTITGNGTLYYTTDGNDPTTSTPTTATTGTPFVLNLNATTTIKAMAKEDGKDASDVVSAVVTKYVQPTSVTVNFSASFLGISNTNSLSGDFDKSVDNVAVNIKKGNASTSTRGDDGYIRLYNGNILKFTAPTGYNITNVTLTQSTENSSKWEGGTVKTWTGEESSASFTFLGTSWLASAAITLEKIQPKYALTIADAVGGTLLVEKAGVAISSGTELKANTELDITATPSTGYDFTTWAVTSGTLGSATSATTTLTTAAAAATLSATFTPHVYTFTATTEDGTLSVKVGDAAPVVLDNGETTEIAYGSTVTVTPIPATNYAFDEWTTTDIDDISIKANPLVFTMPANDVELMAKFVATNVNYDITINQATGGTISSNKSSAKAGETITLSYDLDDHYAFGEWVVEDASHNGVTVTDDKFTMPTSDVTVTATYKPIHTVTYYVSGIQQTPVDRVDGATLSLDEPAAVRGMAFAGWSTSNDVASPVFVANDAAVNSDLTLYAFFTLKQGTVAYRRVEADLSDWRGNYLIAYSSSCFANGKIGGTGANAIGAQYQTKDPGENLSNDIVTKEWGDNYYVSLEAVDDDDLSKGYVLKTQDGKYNYNSSNKNGLNATDYKETAAYYAISVTFTSKSDIKLKLSGYATGAVFRYNTGGYFRFYKDGGQSPVYLYKKGTSSPTYSLGLPIEAVTITSAKYATYCSEQALDFTDSDVKAYTAKVSGTSVVLTKVNVVPAGTGVILYADAADTYEIPVTTGGSVSDNELVGTTAETTVAATADGKYNYILQMDGSTPKFRKATGKKVRANRAYLSTSTAPASAPALDVIFAEENTTGIQPSTVRSPLSTVNSPAYDLSGRRVSADRKGLVIVNGKKIVK